MELMFSRRCGRVKCVAAAGEGTLLFDGFESVDAAKRIWRKMGGTSSLTRMSGVRRQGSSPVLGKDRDSRAFFALAASAKIMLADESFIHSTNLWLNWLKISSMCPVLRKSRPYTCTAFCRKLVTSLPISFLGKPGWASGTRSSSSSSSSNTSSISLPSIFSSWRLGGSVRFGVTGCDSVLAASRSPAGVESRLVASLRTAAPPSPAFAFFCAPPAVPQKESLAPASLRSAPAATMAPSSGRPLCREAAAARADLICPHAVGGGCAGRARTCRA
mmetsp:Transcript_27701/g.79577  ORF Transcript_27701/g.79577 Transcript_27701/m.79577 type:complete len:274 (-) Transcript_27701:96-917(-)